MEGEQELGGDSEVVKGERESDEEERNDNHQREQEKKIESIFQ